MNCTSCHYNYEQPAQYCAQCGKKTVYNPTVNATDKNVMAVWLYVCVMLGIQVMWKIVSLLVVPAIMRNGSYSEIPGIYSTVGLIGLFLNLITLGIIIAIVRNTSARIAVAVFAGVTVLFFLLEKLMLAANLHPGW